MRSCCCIRTVSWSFSQFYHDIDRHCQCLIRADFPFLYSLPLHVRGPNALIVDTLTRRRQGFWLNRNKSKVATRETATGEKKFDEF
eukprot:SM000093S24461  [mRNA]  locus=s93:434765:435180:- [translate_table: standard]